VRERETRRILLNEDLYLLTNNQPQNDCTDQGKNLKVEIILILSQAFHPDADTPRSWLRQLAKGWMLAQIRPIRLSPLHGISLRKVLSFFFFFLSFKTQETQPCLKWP
jgi:hypothetical protein